MFNHVKSPFFLIFEVLPCESCKGKQSDVLPAIRLPDLSIRLRSVHYSKLSERTKFVFADDCSQDSLILVPATDIDMEAGYTHNVVCVGW